MLSHNHTQGNTHTSICSYAVTKSHISAYTITYSHIRKHTVHTIIHCHKFTLSPTSTHSHMHSVTCHTQPYTVTHCYGLTHCHTHTLSHTCTHTQCHMLIHGTTHPLIISCRSFRLGLRPCQYCSGCCRYKSAQNKDLTFLTLKFQLRSFR